jgi:hypothetical protein
MLNIFNCIKYKFNYIMYNIIATSLVLLLLTIPISCNPSSFCSRDYKRSCLTGVISTERLPAFHKRTAGSPYTWCTDIDPHEFPDATLCCCADKFSNCWEPDPLKISGLVIGVIVFIIICVWYYRKRRDNTNDNTNDKIINNEPFAPPKPSVYAVTNNDNSKNSTPIAEAVVIGTVNIC